MGMHRGANCAVYVIAHSPKIRLALLFASSTVGMRLMLIVNLLRVEPRARIFLPGAQSVCPRKARS